MNHALRIPLLALLLLPACSPREGPRPPEVAPVPAAAPDRVPAPAPRPAPTPAPAPVPAGDPRAETCRASEPVVLLPGEGADPKRMRSLVAGFAGDTGLMAWPAGPDRFEAAFLDRDLRPAARIPEELAGSARLFDVLPLGGGFAVVAHDLCPDRKHFQKCLHARWLSAAGVTGPPITIRTKEWIQGWFPIATSPGEAVSLRSHMYERPVVERWRVVDGGVLSVETLRVLGSPGSHAWGRSFLATGTGWQAAVEDEDGSWRLVHADGREAPLPSGGEDTRRGAPEIPGSGAAQVAPALETRDRELFLIRRDAAGRQVGQATKVGPAPRGHGPDQPLLRAFAAGPGRFGAAWSSFEGDRFVVRLALVTCGG